MDQTSAPASSLIVTPSDVERYAPSMQTVNLGAPVRNDLAEWPIIGELYEIYLQAVERGSEMDARVARFARKPIVPYDRNTTFEKFLEDGLDKARWELEVEIDNWYFRGDIDLTVRANNKMVAEYLIGEIRKYLEGTPKERLVGVPEPM